MYNWNGECYRKKPKLQLLLVTLTTDRSSAFFFFNTEWISKAISSSSAFRHLWLQRFENRWNAHRHSLGGLIREFLKASWLSLNGIIKPCCLQYCPSRKLAKIPKKTASFNNTVSLAQRIWWKSLWRRFGPKRTLLACTVYYRLMWLFKPRLLRSFAAQPLKCSWTSRTRKTLLHYWGK